MLNTVGLSTKVSTVVKETVVVSIKGDLDVYNLRRSIKSELPSRLVARCLILNLAYAGEIRCVSVGACHSVI